HDPTALSTLSLHDALPISRQRISGRIRPRPASLRRELSADVASVERARYAGVARALNDGAAIGKNGHFIRGHAKAQQEIVAAHLGRGGLQAPTERREVEPPAVLVDLHRIAAAQREAR